jgi:hypothetical protein
MYRDIWSDPRVQYLLLDCQAFIARLIDDTACLSVCVLLLCYGPIR